MSEPTEMAELSPLQAAERHRDGRIILLDVRERDEWDAGHAPGALHSPLSDLDPAQVATARQVVVAVCRSGNRSGTAARILAAAGVPALNMAGGMSEWARDGLPVVTDAGQPGIVK